MIQSLIARFGSLLGERFEGWDLAIFLCQPSGYLQGMAPVDVLDEDSGDERIRMSANAYLGIGTDT